MKSWTLSELADRTGAQLRGDGTCRIDGLGTLKSAGPHQLSFLANPLYRSALATTGAGAVLLNAEDAEGFTGNALIIATPYAVYAGLTHLFDRTPRPEAVIHPQSVVHPEAVLAPGVSVAACAVIEASATIGAGSVIEAGVFVGARVRIGAGCRLRANSTVHHDCVLGDRVLIHSGAVIGDDGFGFVPAGGRWNKIAQIGRVVIHNDVDIGSGTCIDRGALDDTIIHQGVIIDNLVHIAHNVEIGPHTAIAGCCGISGSTKIGAWCVLAGGVGLAGHIEICDNVRLTGMTMVTKSITKPGSYSSGTAFDSTENWRKSAVRLKKLDDMARRLRELEGLVQQLTSKTD